jgi:hypothetical protein
MGNNQSCPDMSLYTKTSDIQSCPDMSLYTKTSDIQACPDMSLYTKTADIPSGHPGPPDQPGHSNAIVIESSPIAIVKQQPKIWEPLQNHEVMEDAKCTIGNEFLIFCNREGRGALDALNLNFSDIENQITQCYEGETVVCNIKKDTELATLSAGIWAYQNR